LLYKFLGKKGAFYQLDLEPFSIKLNYNCPADYKNGEGQGSCKGYKPGSEALDSKKTTEKKASIVKPVTKSTVKQPSFNPVDIVNRIRTGGKISKEEYDYILPLINKANQPANSSAYTKTQPKTTEEKSKSLPTKKKDVAGSFKKVLESNTKQLPASKQPLNIKAGSGLDKIRSEIKKAGGAEKFFKTADIHAKDQEERKPIDSEKMARIVNLYTESDTFKKPYKEENGVKWYEAKKDGNSIVIAKVGKKIAAYGLKATDPDDPKNPYTTIVASTDFTGKGYGKQAMLEFYDKNPDMIRKTGGLTPMGKKAYLKTLKTIAGE